MTFVRDFIEHQDLASGCHLQHHRLNWKVIVCINLIRLPIETDRSWLDGLAPLSEHNRTETLDPQLPPESIRPWAVLGRAVRGVHPSAAAGSSLSRPIPAVLGTVDRVSGLEVEGRWKEFLPDGVRNHVGVSAPSDTFQEVLGCPFLLDSRRCLGPFQSENLSHSTCFASLPPSRTTLTRPPSTTSGGNVTREEALTLVDELSVSRRRGGASEVDPRIPEILKPTSDGLQAKSVAPRSDALCHYSSFLFL